MARFHHHPSFIVAIVAIVARDLFSSLAIPIAL